VGFFRQSTFAAPPLRWTTFLVTDVSSLRWHGPSPVIRGEGWLANRSSFSVETGPPPPLCGYGGQPSPLRSSAKVGGPEQRQLETTRELAPATRPRPRIGLASTGFIGMLSIFHHCVPDSSRRLLVRVSWTSRVVARCLGRVATPISGRAPADSSRCQLSPISASTSMAWSTGTHSVSKPSSAIEQSRLTRFDAGRSIALT
jgi:hypothetical protein